jgi:GNAT superfamily N-acetyltransferase
MAKLDFELVTDSASLKGFDCGVESINKYVEESYYPSLAQHAYAYNIIGGGKSLGYIQFLFRDVDLDYFPDDISDIDTGVKENVLPAVHIRYIAINQRYQRHKIGSAALKTAISRIEKLAEDWPISMITIDARCDLVGWYEREGFKMMTKNKPGQDGYTVAMYYSCIRYPEKLYAYIEDAYESML